jgi:tetratricopeptide (TPR) repeat protein
MSDPSGLRTDAQPSPPAGHLRRAAQRFHHSAIAANDSPALLACRQAVEQRPDDVEARYRLAQLLVEQGQADQARAHFEQVLRQAPDHADAHASLGLVLARHGKLDEGIAAFRRSVQLRPGVARTHHNLAVALAERGQLQEACASFEEALRLQPRYAEAHFHLGNTLLRLGQREQAVAHFRLGLSLKPDNVNGLNNLGLALTELGRHAEAVFFLQQTTRLAPNLVEPLNNLGLALTELGRFAEAQAVFEQALRLRPTFANAHTNLATVAAKQGRFAEALAGYEMSLWLRPEGVSPHWNRSLTWLQMGDFQRGWADYEWRWRRQRSPARPFTQPRWDGSPLGGRTLLIYMEQGLGDMIQFIRCAALVRQRGGSVVVECPRKLVPLFARCDGIDQLVAEGDPLPPFDVQVPLMSLPGLLGITLASIPARVPYLSAEPAFVEHWGPRLRTGPGLRVGIAWQGNPRHRSDRHRSVALTQFAPLARLPGVRLISLQQEHGCEQLAALAGRFLVEDAGPGRDGGAWTFADTAAVLGHLDLVVSVDTALAHLAGALTVPAWVALAADPDWRWLLDRDDSPWYPTMRLFRQEQLGQWKPVFARIADEVARLRPPAQAPGPVGAAGPTPEG